MPDELTAHSEILQGHVPQRPCFWDCSIRFDLFLTEALLEMEMSTRLAEKLTKASGVAKRITETIEARADALIARETAIDRRTEDVFRPHEDVLGDAERGLDAAEAALRLLSNGAPLEPSDDSPAAPEVGQDTTRTFPAA